MKNTVIIGALCVLAIAVGAWFYFTSTRPVVPQNQQAAADTDSSKETDVPFKVLGKGDNAQQFTQRKNYAIYDANEFATFWKKVHGNDGTPLPQIDFSRNYVIGVFAGTVQSGGYSIAVSSVTDSGNMRSIAVVIDAPGDSCNVIQEQTTPYQFVSVPFSDAQALSHTDVQEKKDCK